MNKPPTRRKAILYGLLAAAALGLLAFAALREPVQLVRAAAVTPGPLVQGFVEEGKTRVRARYAIASPVAGQLQRVALQAGDAVAADQVLAEVAPATAALLDAGTRAQLSAQAQGAQQQVASGRARVQAADAADTLAQADAVRAQALRAAGHVSAAYVQAATARAQAAAAERAAARAEADAATSRAAAVRALLAAQGQPSGTPLALRAPAAGVVLRRLLESATPIAPGQVVMEIGDAADLEVVAEVLSTDAVRLAPGMAAQVLRWGGEGADAELAAHVTRVEPGGYTKVSALGVEEQRTHVVLALDAPHQRWARLGDAYRVEVQFITGRAERALQLPSSSLFRTEQGWAVYRIDGGRARLTPVTLGLRSAAAAEVKTGLTEGQQVIVQPDDRIHDGARVQAAPR